MDINKKISKQELARRRNFNKFRFMGFCLDKTALSSWEKAMYTQWYSCRRLLQ